MPARRKLPLLDVDPDLGALVPDDRREAARRELEVEVYRLPQGAWSAGGEDPNPQLVGLLLVEGVIAREVLVSDTVITALLGPGDVVRPWSVQESPVLLQLQIRWDALTESRVAVLEKAFGGLRQRAGHDALLLGAPGAQPLAEVLGVELEPEHQVVRVSLT